MGSRVAEYLGQRVDLDFPVIVPVLPRAGDLCPFMNAKCSKQATGNKPVCSVRKRDGDLWIVCRHRLCATKKKVEPTVYQRGILLQIAKIIFGPSTVPGDILVKPEVSMPVTDDSTYHADYVMISQKPNANGPNKVILEMQGGGETTDTGKLSKIVSNWESDPRRSNALLRTEAPTVGTLETNAWRRQQEQFLVKGKIATQTGQGCGIVFCMGKLLYDYVWLRVKDAGIKDLRKHNWDLALLGFIEDDAQPKLPGPIPLSIDPARTVFTDYSNFVRALSDQGSPSPITFKGRFQSLSGQFIDLP